MDVQVAREVLQVDGEFTYQELLKQYRIQARVKHPDVGGSESDFVELQEAYSVLEGEAVSGEGYCGDVRETIEGYPLSDLGKGYPLSESARTCDVCDGKGYQKFTESRGYKTVDCVECRGEGIVNYPCKRCGGTGRYKHPKTGRDVGECHGCKGTGVFYPENKRMRKTPSWGGFFSPGVKYIPGTRKMGVTCQRCSGYGRVRVPSGEVKNILRRCDECRGVGEIKMWNPVIPRGFLMSSGGE